LLRKEKACETFEKGFTLPNFQLSKDAGFALLILRKLESGLIASRGA
jgi:hypothetical protein